VGAGDALFNIDDRDVQSQRLSARAGIKEAQAKLRQAREQLRLVESVPDRRAISTAERDGHRFAVKIAQAGLAAAQARRDQLTLEIDRRTVRALAPGKILQINIRPGEFAQSGVLARPLVLLGNDSRLYVRVDIDGFDAARITPGAAAVAFVRADAQRQVRLTFERIEPCVAPKTSLTGRATERVDTRVLQVIYSFEHAALAVYIGQQMDVYIEAPRAQADFAWWESFNDAGRTSLIRRALIAYRSAILNALEEVENAIVAHANAQLRRAALADAVLQHALARDLSRSRYLGGLADMRDVLDADHRLAALKNELTQGEVDAATTLVALHKSLGGGWLAAAASASAPCLVAGVAAEATCSTSP
jgi:hypothetical protein